MNKIIINDTEYACISFEDISIKPRTVVRAASSGGTVVTKDVSVAREQYQAHILNVDYRTALQWRIKPNTIHYQDRVYSGMFAIERDGDLYTFC